MTLSSLIARVEGLTEHGNYQVECEVFELVGKHLHGSDDRVPVYTRSIDAATSIFPEDCFYRSGHDGAGPDVTLFYCEAIPAGPNGWPLQGVKSVAVTEPLARLGAALRARDRISTGGE